MPYAPDHASPVFIVGCDRSGTTLLRRMLTQSSDLHVLQESGFFGRLRRQADLYGDFSQPHERWFFIRDLQTNAATSQTKTFPVFDLTPEQAERAIAEVAPTDLPGASTSLFAASARARGKRRWGDKTPRYVLEVEWLAAAYPTAQFVHVIRDGRDVVSSMMSAGWHRNCTAAAHHWADRVSSGREAGAALGSTRYREVAFEALLSAPESTLESICGWLGLRYSEDMLTFHRSDDKQLPSEHANLHWRATKPVDASRAFAWRSGMRKRDVADVEAVGGELLEALGYPRSMCSVPLWLRAARAMLRASSPCVLRVRDALRTIRTP